MKKLLNVILCLVMLSSLAVPAFAATESNTQVFKEATITGEKFVDPALVGMAMPGGVMPLDDYNEIPVVRDTLSTKETVYVTPSGQPSLGYKGGNDAFVFFFSTGGGSVKFTVTINMEAVTFTAETGKTATNGQGYGAYLPSESGNYQFQFIKDYVITTKIIDVYQHGIYKYTYMIHDPQYSLGHRWVKL